MNNYFTNAMSDFFMNVIEKLNGDNEQRKILSEVMTEICEYFDFGCGFIYIADQPEMYVLYESYQKSDYYKHLPEALSFRQCLGDSLYKEMCHSKCITFDAEKEKTSLELALSDMFRANSLIVVPINTKGIKVPAFVGMMDRRGKSRNQDQDLRFADFILSVIANYIDTMIVRQRSEGTMNTLRSILDNTGVDVYVIDYENYDLLYVNKSLAEKHGGEDNMIGKKCWDGVLGKDCGPCEFCPRNQLVDQNNQPNEPYIWNYFRENDQTWQRMISSAFYWIDGRLALAMSNVDITENKKNEETIRRHAEYDTLTGLPNRHKLLIDCDDGIERLKQKGQEGFMIFCDLDRFKAVNDHYGHNIGDELLRSIGEYFEQNELTRGRAYRYAGDEFVILCLDDTREEVEAILKCLKQDFEIPWKLSIGDLQCRCSCGLTSYPNDALTTSDLLHSADIKMYMYKKKTYQ